MKKFFLGIIAGSMSMVFVWMYIFRWPILESFTETLANIISEKRAVDRTEHHEHLARARARRRHQYGPATPKR